MHDLFVAFLVEHDASNFPLWLAPEQARVLTLNDEVRDYGKNRRS